MSTLGFHTFYILAVWKHHFTTYRSLMLSIFIKTSSQLQNNNSQGQGLSDCFVSYHQKSILSTVADLFNNICHTFPFFKESIDITILRFQPFVEPWLEPLLKEIGKLSHSREKTNPVACSSLILPLDGKCIAELRNTPPRLNRDVQSPGDNRIGECIFSSHVSAKFTCPHTHTPVPTPPAPHNPSATANHHNMTDLYAWRYW